MCVGQLYTQRQTYLFIKQLLAGYKSPFPVKYFKNIPNRLRTRVNAYKRVQIKIL